MKSLNQKERKNNFQEITISKIIEEVPDVKTFRFQTKKNLDFEIGQFVILRFPENDEKYKIGQRAYTISSIPNNENYFELTIQKVGRFTIPLFDCKINDKLLFKGPYGQNPLNGQDKEIVFLPGGCGITPFLSILRSIQKTKKDYKITIIYSCKTPDTIIRKKEIGDICKENPNIKCYFTITRPRPEDKNWKGFIGRINKDLIKKLVPDLKTKKYVLCGTNNMIQELKKTLIEDLKVPKEKVIAENWG